MLRNEIFSGEVWDLNTAEHEDGGSDAVSLRPRCASGHAEFHAHECFMLLGTRTSAQPQQQRRSATLFLFIFYNTRDNCCSLFIFDK